MDCNSIEHWIEKKSLAKELSCISLSAFVHGWDNKLWIHDDDDEIYSRTKQRTWTKNCFGKWRRNYSWHMMHQPQLNHFYMTNYDCTLYSVEQLNAMRKEWNHFFFFCCCLTILSFVFILWILKIVKRIKFVCVVHVWMAAWNYKVGKQNERTNLQTNDFIVK